MFNTPPRRPPSIVDELETQAELDLVAPEHAARHLGMPVEALFELASQRQIMHYANGSVLLFPVAELDRWLIKNRTATRKTSGRLGLRRTA